MLAKIIKHEFKATYRTFFPIYILLFILTGIGCLVMPWLREYNSPLLAVAFGFGVLILVLGYIFVVMSPYLFLSVRFYRTTATREAYLTFTVPAETRTILLGKFIVSLIWTVGTILLWFLSLLTFIFFVSGETSVNEFLSGFGDNIIWQILSMLVSTSSALLGIFAAIALSQLVRDHRILASFGFYMALYTVQQIVSVIALLPFLIRISKSQSQMLDSISASVVESSPISGDEVPVFALAIAISVVFGVAYYFITNYMLKKKLNLL